MRTRTLLVCAALAALVVGCQTQPPSNGSMAQESPTSSQDDGEATAPDGEDDGGSDGSDGDAGVGLEAVPDLVDEVGPSVVAIRLGQGIGSGVIWSEDGLIVTNAHVVEAARDGIDVVLASGRTVPGNVLGSDARTDVAVIRVDETGLPAATFADDLPDVGELAVALGNPLGFENSATAGIVSGLNRELPASADGPVLAGLLQTDAPISPGNSGGALVSGRGEVIGINVAAVSGQTGGSNLGFAIPAPTVVQVAAQLVEQGEVRHAALGVRGASLTPQVAERFGLETESGVVVAEVVDGSPADRAGIRSGDVLVGLEGEELETIGDLVIALREHDPGETVTVELIRDGEQQQVEVELEELPS